LYNKRKIKTQNSEFLTLTYGALVTQMLRDFENAEDVNKQLERIGYRGTARAPPKLIAPHQTPSITITAIKSE